MDMRKNIEETIVKFLMIVATCIIIGSFFIIIGVIIYKGLPSLNWAMISQASNGGFYIGKEGGILNAIIGSMYIAGGATICSLLISIPIVLYLNVYLKKNSWLGNLTRFTADVLFGIPSIVYGAFGFTLMIFLGLKTSLLAGIVTVTLLILPIMLRTIDEVAITVPEEILESTYALGATRLEACLVFVRKAFPGILTAILLSFGRGIGDAASVLFTAGFSDNIPVTLNEPTATLPLAIFFQLGSPFPEVQSRAYAAAFILTLIVLAISVTSRIISQKYMKNNF